MSQNNLKEEILLRADIVEIISEYLPLRKRGRNYIGLCPFHNEKTPSFTVSEEKQFYKCFGCGKSGNVFTFLMEKNAFSFVETLKYLSQKYNINYEINENYKESSTEYEEIYNILKDSADFFIQKLDSDEGEKCRNYFESRQFTNKIIKEFKLGYSPNSFDALSKHLLEKGYEEEIIAKSGMNVQNENNRIYDRFRDRAMFPVFDTFGRIIGFGARLLSDEKTQPKYLNTPQTKVYDKSRTLYGLYQGKNEIIDKKFSMLVEGYADVITLYQNGFKNAVASSGTALTPEQLKILSRFSKTLTIVYDSDSAGINAAERAIDIALQNGFLPEVISLPAGEDPDSVVREKGKKTFQSFLDNRKNFLDFLFNINSQNPKFDNVLGKTEIIKKIMQTINLVSDDVQRDLLIQELARKLDFNDFQIRNLYKLQLQVKKEQEKKEKLTQKDTIQTSDEVKLNIQIEQKSKKIIRKLKKPEYELLRLILSNEGMFEEFKGINFNYEKLISSTSKTILSYVVQFANMKQLMDELNNNKSVDPYLKNVITNISLSQITPSENWDKYFTDSNQGTFKIFLKKIYLNLDLNKLDNEITNAQKRLEEGLDDLERISTLEIINSLSHEKNAIKTKLSEI